MVQNPPLDKVNCMQILKPCRNIKEERAFLYCGVNILNLERLKKIGSHRFDYNKQQQQYYAYFAY
jgi:hypothetical protein